MYGLVTHAASTQELEKMVQQARRESTKADDLVRSLTPRPNWPKLDAAIHGATSSAPTVSMQQQAAQHSALQAEPTATTRDLVDRLVKEHKQALARVAELEPLEKQLQEALRLLEPEPCLGPLQLQPTASPTDTAALEWESQQPAVPPVSTSSAAAAAATASGKGSQASTSSQAPAVSSAGSTVAFTGAATAAGSSQSAAARQDPGAPQHTAGLGWSGVPRFLRWDGPVALQPMTLPALQSLLHSIWAAKAVFDTEHQVQHSLLSFVWRFFRAKHAQQGLVAAAGYSLLSALAQHQADSAMANMFLRVLEGRWQEAMWHDCRHMLQAVSLILQALSEFKFTSLLSVKRHCTCNAACCYIALATTLPCPAAACQHV